MRSFNRRTTPEVARPRGAAISVLCQCVVVCAAAVALITHVVAAHALAGQPGATSLGNQSATVAPEVLPGEPGDANCDGRISAADLPAALGALGGTGSCPSAASVRVTIAKIFDPIEQSLNALAAGDLRTANDLSCQDAAAAGPRNDRALLLCALTRFAVKVIDAPQLRVLLQRSGGSLTGDSRDLCGLDGSRPRTVPPGAPRTGEIVDALRSLLLPEIDATLRDLKRLPDSVDIDFDPRFLPVCGRPGPERGAIEIDHGDVLALTGLLQLIRTELEILAAYDVDVDLATFVEGPAQTVLMREPQLLALRTAAKLGTARASADQALESFSTMVSSVLGETDDQSNDLVVIEPRNVEDARRTARTLDQVRLALRGEVVVMPDLLPDQLTPPQRLNLNPFFSGQFDTLRRFLPAFDDQGGFDFSALPDPTFGGSVPDLKQSDICSLRFERRPLCP